MWILTAAGAWAGGCGVGADDFDGDGLCDVMDPCDDIGFEVAAYDPFSTGVCVSPSATVGRGVVFNGPVRVFDSAYIGARATLDGNNYLEASSFVGRRAHLATGAEVYEQAVVSADAYVGENCQIFYQAQVGYGATLGGWDSGASMGCWVGDHRRVANLVTTGLGFQAPTYTAELRGVSVTFETHVGRDTTIGDHVYLAPDASVGADAYVGSEVTIGSDSRVRRDATIQDYVEIGAATHIGRDVTVCAGNNENWTFVGSNIRVRAGAIVGTDHTLVDGDTVRAGDPRLGSDCTGELAG